ncbi:light-harvesting protein of photosystem I [Raphidocelis subcapitata]|uniref:Chlorophyll a-b binding protein, chloroplastic n=1 Tax=Raphidocelis subcapitata TaxID=307507 RepID=A0A2V0P6K4_9CHLO|nr:light-harvesting protein of photosystem I [Raphidocelis subcapitata]|eukprot:GBF95488.1 light-harvesting protein of photosystem I [Raphidocelis subcapitata]
MALSSKTALRSAAVRGTATRGVARVSRARTATVQARAGNWLPGSAAPEWLPDSLPGNFGFDPLGLAKDPASLQRFQESEVIHSRWAMLGVAGCLAVELLGFGNWYDAPLWAINGGNATWFGIDVPFDLNTLLAVEFVAMAAAESRRGDESDAAKRIYPGGAFDPMGMSKGNIEELKLKELKNGRLAMVAFLGFVAQHAATGKAPLEALSAHVGNPWGSNFATNGVSLPF